jgi:hypothetical protein
MPRKIFVRIIAKKQIADKQKKQKRIKQGSFRGSPRIF